MGNYPYHLELNLAVVASRSSLVGALLRNTIPVNQLAVSDFLQGLSLDELECLAEFQGACVIEAEYSETCNSYRLMSDFFDPEICARWRQPDARAHKTFIVLAWLDHLGSSIPAPFQPKPCKQPS